MEKRAFNPTPWLLHFNLNHAVEVRSGSRTLYLSGQTSSDADGNPLNVGDIVGQVHEAWSQLRAALAAADMTTANIVRLNMYTTDVDAFMANAGEFASLWAAENGMHPVGTLLGVTRLYHPDIMVELEATAVA